MVHLRSKYLSGVLQGAELATAQRAGSGAAERRGAERREGS